MKGTNKKNANNNTTPDTTNTNNNTEREEKNTMKSIIENTTPANTDTLTDNIKQSLVTLAGDVEKLEKLLNMDTRAVIVNAMKVTVGKDTRKVNDLLAYRYYINTPLFDIIKNGDKVPAAVIETTENNGVYKVTVKHTTVYPTLAGMKDAGVIDDDIFTRVDALRRVSAFVKSKNTATVFLTGDTANKKDCPTEKVKTLIDGMGDLSKNKARGLMTKVFRDLTGEAYKKEIFPRLYDEFEGYICKRSRKWGERNMVSKNTAGDMVLEFAWMYFTGKTEFKYNGENN